jgi:hypothetical protein
MYQSCRANHLTKQWLPAAILPLRLLLTALFHSSYVAGSDVSKPDLPAQAAQQRRNMYVFSAVLACQLDYSRQQQPAHVCNVHSSVTAQQRSRPSSPYTVYVAIRAVVLVMMHLSYL